MSKQVTLFIASRSSKKTPSHKRISIASYDVRPQISSDEDQSFYRSDKNSMQLQAVIALSNGLKYLLHHGRSSDTITIVANTAYLRHAIDGKLKYWEKHHWISQKHTNKGKADYKKIPQCWIDTAKYLERFSGADVKIDRHNKHLKEMRKSLLNHLTNDKKSKPDDTSYDIDQITKAVDQSSKETENNSQDLQKITSHSFSDKSSEDALGSKVSALKKQVSSLRNKLSKSQNNHDSKKLHKQVHDLKQLSSTLQSRIKDDIQSMAEADKKIQDNKKFKSRYYDVSSRNKSLVENNRQLAKVISDFKHGRIIVDHNKNLWRIL